MNDLLSLSVASWVRPLALAALVTVGGLLAMALRHPHLAKIGLRNVPRRWLRSWLVVAGLLLATMFIGAALAVGDTIPLAVKNVAVFNLGRIDEQVIGGEGTLGLFPAEVGGIVQQALGSDAHVAEVTPALVVPNLLVADDTARQVRGGISGLALASSESGPLTDLRARTGSGNVLQQLTPGGLYLNRSADQLLGAQPGDKLYLYSTVWPGHRYAFRLRGVVSGGPLGDSPAAVLNLGQLQQLVGVPGAINRVYIANAGDGLTGVGFSDEITDRVAPALPFGLHTQQIKFEGVQFALQAQSIFGRILTLFTLFALAIGMLLIFLIFVLSAAERRAELGVARAIGMRRSHTVWLLLFEGSVYNVAAAGLGMLAGLGLGVAVVGGGGAPPSRALLPPPPPPFPRGILFSPPP